MNRLSIYGHDWEVLQDDDGDYVLYEDAAKLERERDDWKSTHDSFRAVYRDIGNALGADMPAELVNEVARSRMAELEAVLQLINDLEIIGAEETLPKSVRYAIERYRKVHPKC